MGVWAERSSVTSNSTHCCIHRGNDDVGKALERLHVGLQQPFGDGCAFERKQHQLQTLYEESRALAARDVIRRQLRDGQRDHHPGCKGSEQVTLNVDYKWILLTYPRTWVLVNVELHSPTEQPVVSLWKPFICRQASQAFWSPKPLPCTSTGLLLPDASSTTLPTMSAVMADSVQPRCPCPVL
jgi:hypothetical protein